MPLINCENYLILIWSANCLIIANAIDSQVLSTFFDNWYKTLCPSCSLLTQDNAKLLDKLKSGFKRTISWNKYQPKAWIQATNQYSDDLIDPNSIYSRSK